MFSERQGGWFSLLMKQGVRFTASGLLWLVSATAGFAEAPASPEVRQIASAIRESHQRLFRLEGGLAITYSIDVEQDPAAPVFTYKDRVDGTLNLKWPALRCRASGLMRHYKKQAGGRRIDEWEMEEREGSYDFENLTGAGRDSRVLGQVTNYRHAFSAILGFPLLYQCFAEMDQHYVPGEILETDYLLPDVLEQHEYQVDGEETVDGIVCRVVSRPGIDRIWIATGNGNVLCKREFNFGPEKPIDARVQNRGLREIAEGVWIPTQQIYEKYSQDVAEKRLARFVLNVTDTRVGNLQDRDVEVDFTDVRKVEDHISNTIYEYFSREPDRFDLAIENARARGLVERVGRARVNAALLLANVAVLLGVANYFVWRNIQRKTSDSGS